MADKSWTLQQWQKAHLKEQAKVDQDVVQIMDRERKRGRSKLTGRQVRQELSQAASGGKGPGKAKITFRSRKR